MGFSGAGAADEDRIALGIEEGAGSELANLPFIDRRIREDELVDILEDRELGSADAVADRAGLPVGVVPDQQRACNGDGQGQKKQRSTKRLMRQCSSRSRSRSRSKRYVDGHAPLDHVPSLHLASSDKPSAI